MRNSVSLLNVRAAYARQRTLAGAARQLECSIEQVRGKLIKGSVPFSRRPGQPRALPPVLEQAACDFYMLGNSQHATGKKFGVNPSTVVRILEDHGLPTRDRSRAAALSHQTRLINRARAAYRELRR